MPVPQAAPLHDALRRKIREERLRQGISTINMAARIGWDVRRYERLESGESITLDIGVIGNAAHILSLKIILLDGEVSISRIRKKAS